MFVNQVYDLMRFIIDKNITGEFSANDFNLIINPAQKSYASFLLGSFQQYQYGRPIARVELGQNAIIRERLSPFIGSPTTLTVSGSGVATQPADYMAFDAMIYGSSFKRVKLIEADRLDSHLNSVIDPIATNPVCMKINGGFQFYPITISTPKLSYVATPADIIYGTTLDGNGRPVYDAGTSQQPRWFDVDMMEIIVRALAQVGVNLQLAQVQQYSQMIKTQGQ